MRFTAHGAIEMAGPWNRHRRDKSHDPIVKRLRDLGCSVLDTSQVGNGAPDMVVGLLGRNYLIEAKSYGKPLSDGQLEWHQAWLGHPPTVIWTPEQCEAWVKTTRQRFFAEFRIK